ncbi:hypothetical protein V8D89_006221 [Ganoderma adspersum]
MAGGTRCLVYLTRCMRSPTIWKRSMDDLLPMGIFRSPDNWAAGQGNVSSYQGTHGVASPFSMVFEDMFYYLSEPVDIGYTPALSYLPYFLSSSFTLLCVLPVTYVRTLLGSWESFPFVHIRAMIAMILYVPRPLICASTLIVGLLL